MTSKKFLAALLVALMVVLNFAPAATVNAAATDPYCRISYDSNVGCNTVKYYYYVGGSARYDATRLVKFYDGKILVSTSNTEVTTKHKSGTNPAWNNTGSFLVWIESDNTLQCRAYSGTSNTKLADNASSLGLNAESMVETVSFADGSSKSINDLLAIVATVAPTATPTVTPTTAPTATAIPTITPTTAPTATAAPTVTATATAPTTETVSTSVKEWTDSAGQEHFEFSGNEVIVDGSDVYLNDFKISELCNSGVRFIGIDTSNRVYLYEDASNTFYRFNQANIFAPEKIKFGEGCELVSVNIDNKGYLIEVVTSIGTFKVSQLVADSTWYPSISYAVNKSGYSTYYLAETNTTYVLTLKETKLYLGTTLVATGITRSTESFGFKGSYIYYLKGSLEYKAPLANPKKAALVQQNVAKLTYSTKTGLVTGMKRLSTKVDYVKNYATKSVWYQSGKKIHTIKISKDKKKVLLDGKVVAKLSKKETNIGYRVTYVGFTEDGNIFYCKPYSYKASIKKPTSAKKWSLKTFKRNSIGFVEKTK